MANFFGKGKTPEEFPRGFCYAGYNSAVSELLVGLNRGSIQLIAVLVHSALRVYEYSNYFVAVHEEYSILEVYAILRGLVSNVQFNACNALLVLGVNADNNQIVGQVVLLAFL